MRKLSELEGVSLGIIYNHQPCTAYFVRQLLKNSPSSHWQASAGSVYPLVIRLEENGLLSSKGDGDKRGRKQLAITQKGIKSIREWIMLGVQTDMISAIMDPIRNRISFLQLLNIKQQVHFLNQLVNEMEELHQQTKVRLKETPRNENIYTYLVASGAEQTTKSRLIWIKEARDVLLEATVS